MHARNGERGRDGPLVSLVFPTYNPGAFLERTCGDVARFLDTAPGNWEVWFICDGCSDGSTERLEAWARTDPSRRHVLSYAPNRGKGYAVRLGLAAARGQWRIFTDVDLAYGFDDVQRLADTLRGGAEVAIASRLHPESRLSVPSPLLGYAYRRYVQSLAFSAVVRTLLPLTQLDTQAGLKGMSAAAAQQILPRLRCNGFEFDCELLTACAHLGLAVTELPVCVRYDDRASTTSLSSVGRMVRELWKIRQAWRTLPALPPAETTEPGRRQAA